MHQISAKQAFHYPALAEPQFGLTAGVGAVLCGLAAAFMLWTCIYAPTIHRDQIVYQWSSVLIFLGFAVLLWHFHKLQGYVEVDETGIRRFFRDGSSVILNWNEIEIAPNTFFSSSKNVNLSSTKGNKSIVLVSDMKGYEELKSIVDQRLKNN